MSTHPMADPLERDPSAADLVREVLGNLFAQLGVDEVASCFAGAADGLVRWWVEQRPRGGLPAGESAEDLPAAVWRDIRRRDPRVAAFPLGPVAERAVKRFVAEARRRAAGPGGAASVTPGWLFHTFLGMALFEAVMLNLRGSTDEPAYDYGFWYHWTTGGQWRSRERESELRSAIARQCRRLAAELLAVWRRLQPLGSCPRRRDLVQALREAVGVAVRYAPRGRRRRRAPVTVLGLRPDDAIRRRKGPIAYDAQPIVLSGDGANVLLETNQLVARCGGRLHSLSQDLLDIAAGVYMADIYVPRDPLLARDLVFLLPVRHPEVWSEQAAPLRRLVGFLTGNYAEFRFVGAPGAERSEPRRFEVAADERCVSLFSGGLDSFAGAVHLAGQGRKPLLVSHAPAAALKAMQDRLLRALRDGGADLAGVTVPVAAASRGVAKLHQLGRPPEQVLYQHARSFLFLALASVLAVETACADIFVCENGPVALNPAFSEARFNTKTTHPTVLAGFAELVRAVFGAEIRILNPFELATKGEVLARLDGRWHALLARTNSCWAYSKVMVWAQEFGAVDFRGAHCGRCIPCVWRRAAFRRAGLEALDDRYLWDSIPGEQWPRWLTRRHFTVLLDEHRFCANALALGDRALLDLCPDLWEAAPGRLADRLAMVRRFAQEMTDWFEHGPGRFEAAGVRLPALPHPHG